VKQALHDKKAANEHTDLDKLVALDTQRREAQAERDKLAAEKNTVSKQIAPLMGKLKKAEGAEAEAIQAEINALQKASSNYNTKMEALQRAQNAAEAEMDAIMAWLPNLPDASVPPGEDASANQTVRTWGEETTFDFEPKFHHDLGPELGLLELERGARCSGSGWYFLKGDGARLERALISYFLDTHRENGYVELLPPFMVTEKTLFGSGQLPKFLDQMYHCVEDKLFAIPTSEVPLTSFYRDEILETADLPKYFAAFSACFRREAGAAGSDTRGILRVHQFNKVEMYKFVQARDSFDELEKMLADAEALLQALGLRYRVLLLCRGDMTFGSAKTYDLEIWAPASQRWLEVSSVSNMTDFQARRCNIRYRPEPDSGDKKKPKLDFVHTLNGSGLALPRLQVALWETYQQADGSVLIPEVIRPYLGGQERIVKPTA
jgi:seryl-tRNA synthetase